MTNDDLISLARECGFRSTGMTLDDKHLFVTSEDELSAFAAKMRDIGAEGMRRRAASICRANVANATDWGSSYYDQASEHCAIRIECARSNEQ